MVAKISTGGNMFGALAYNQNKVDSGEAKVLFSNRMLLGEDGNFSIGECMRSFEMQTSTATISTSWGCGWTRTASR